MRNAERGTDQPPVAPTGVGAQPAVPDSALRAPRSTDAPLIVVSGPAGVGKTTVVTRLLEGTNLSLRRAVTATTRDPRAGEVDGVDYHFWGEGEFRRAIDDGRMLEWAVVFGLNFYGTPRSEVDPYRACGVGVILVIDVQGAARVRELLPGDHLSVFIEPPSFEELEARLRGRKDTSEDRIRRRLETARDEMAQASTFHHRVVNRDLADAVAELERIVRARFH
ncbi:MAG: guanylate kinase [Gemmataceae bacterium]|nr:guanylate kinase [Gemmataceae bacterium]